MFKALFIALFVLGLDFASKSYMCRELSWTVFSSPAFPYGGVPVFRDFCGIGFSLNLVTNHGAAWGAFASYQHILQLLRMAATFAIIVHLIFFNRIPQRRIPLALIAAGASGNIIDYYLYGHVIDMFHFSFWGHHFPTFNVADSAIFCGVALLILEPLLLRRKVKTIVE
jgi:signal peptidase II